MQCCKRNDSSTPAAAAAAFHYRNSTGGRPAPKMCHKSAISQQGLNNSVHASNSNSIVAMQVSTLQHPFIVPCVESWLVQGHTVNTIYGYCEKGDLSSYLQRVQRMVSSKLAAQA
jgi:hypothetical protein